MKRFFSTVFNNPHVRGVFIGVAATRLTTNQTLWDKLRTPVDKPKTFYDYTKYTLIDKKQSTFESLFEEPENVYNLLYDEIIRAPANETIDIVISTVGGNAVDCFRICNAIKQRKLLHGGKTRVFVSERAYSAGAIIALCADEIYLTPYASLSAIDPQLNIVKELLSRSLNNITIPIQSKDVSKDHYDLMNKKYETIIHSFLNDKYDMKTKGKIIKAMYRDVYSHEQLFFQKDLEKIGIEIKLWNNIILGEPNN